MLPKMGNKLPRRGTTTASHLEFNRAIAEALRKELGGSHRAIKVVMRWTGASESAVKNWLAGSHGPSGEHLVSLMRNSDTVLATVLVMAGRDGHLTALKTAELKRHLVEILDLIEKLE